MSPVGWFVIGALVVCIALEWMLAATLGKLETVRRERDALRAELYAREVSS